MVADVPIGASAERRRRFERGGRDDGPAQPGTASRRSRSASTTRDGYDERPFARIVAERYGTDHHEFVVQAERGRPGREARLAPRPAVRRFERDPHVPAGRADARSRHRRACRRRWRRAVRRLRAVRGGARRSAPTTPFPRPLRNASRARAGAGPERRPAWPGREPPALRRRRRARDAGRLSRLDQLHRRADAASIARRTPTRGRGAISPACGARRAPWSRSTACSI